MKDNDLRIGLILVTIFLVLYGISFTFPKSAMSETHTGAAFFPRVVLLVATGLTLLLIGKALLAQRDSLRRKGLSREQKVRVVGTMGAAALFGIGAVSIGTFLSLFLLITILMILWGVRKIGTILFTAAGTSILIYVVFTKFLEVQFPAGFLF